MTIRMKSLHDSLTNRLFVVFRLQPEYSLHVTVVLVFAPSEFQLLLKVGLYLHTCCVKAIVVCPPEPLTELQDPPQVRGSLLHPPDQRRGCRESPQPVYPARGTCQSTGGSR